MRYVRIEFVKIFKRLMAQKRPAEPPQPPKSKFGEAALPPEASTHKKQKVTYDASEYDASELTLCLTELPAAAWQAKLEFAKRCSITPEQLIAKTILDYIDARVQGDATLPNTTPAAAAALNGKIALKIQQMSYFSLLRVLQVWLPLYYRRKTFEKGFDANTETETLSCSLPFFGQLTLFKPCDEPEGFSCGVDFGHKHKKEIKCFFGGNFERVKNAVAAVKRKTVAKGALPAGLIKLLSIELMEMSAPDNPSVSVNQLHADTNIFQTQIVEKFVDNGYFYIAKTINSKEWCELQSSFVDKCIQ